MAYEPRKAAQLAAALILKNGKQPLDTLKLVKLIYLVDREAIKEYGFPLLDEPRYSLPHGPVNSFTYNFIKGEVRPEQQKIWAEFIADREGHKVSLAQENIGAEDLDELSEADWGCIESVWQRHGAKDTWELVDWTHDPRNIPEWEDPHGSALPISLRSIVYCLELPNAAEIVARYEEMQADDAVSDLLRAG